MPDGSAQSSPRPPAHIEPYVRVLGVDGAVSFLLTFGGAELYMAANPQGRSRLAALVGIEKAAELARVSEQMPRRIPTAKPWLAQVLKSKGLPVSEIARKLHSSDVSVRGWLKRAGPTGTPDTRQLRLF